MDTEGLLKELFELRRSQFERDTVVRLNNKYIASVAQLQIKASQLSLEIKGKDTEIARRKQAGASTKDQPTDEELTLRIKLLETENSQLQILKHMPAQVETLQKSLELAKTQRDKLRKKYREALIVAKPVEAIDPQILNLKEKKSALQQQIQKAEITAKEATAEVEYLKTQVIPVIQRTLTLYEQNNQEMREELSGLMGSACTHEPTPLTESQKNSPKLEKVMELSDRTHSVNATLNAKGPHVPSKKSDTKKSTRK